MRLSADQPQFDDRGQARDQKLDLQELPWGQVVTGLVTRRAVLLIESGPAQCIWLAECEKMVTDFSCRQIYFRSAVFNSTVPAR